MKTLVVAEKPSAARDIEKGLRKYGAFKKHKLYFESDKFIIAWAHGHLLRLKMPKEYDNFKGWRLDGLPWEPPKYEYIVNKNSKETLKQFKELFDRKDVGLVINACDAGREGENIFWSIYEACQSKLPVKRFFESASLTPGVIQHTIENDLKNEDFFLPRKDAAKARQHADYLIGMNFTIGLTAKSKKKMIAGRVKVPVLKLLKDRKDEIENFKPTDYHEIVVDFGKYKGQWHNKNISKIDSKNEANKILQKIKKQQKGIIISKKVEEIYESQPKLFSLSTLQQEASRKFGFSLNKTSQIAQSLYETHKLTTYPRTDSEVLGTAHIPKLKPILESIRNIPEYSAFSSQILDSGIKTSKHFIDDSKLTDHHAIVPNEGVEVDLNQLNDDELKIYDLIVRRFLAVFFPKAVYEKTEIITKVGNEYFKTTGKIELEKNWKKVIDVKDKKEDFIPDVEEEEEVEIKKIDLLTKQTSPPKHYTNSSLLGVMKDPRRFIAEKELKQAMKESESGGLGTPATRASIIEDLIREGYIIQKKQQLIISRTGEALLSIAPEHLKSVKITAEWEKKLREIELGKRTYEDFMQEIRDFIHENIDVLKRMELSNEFNEKTRKEIISNCPKCGKGVFETKKAYLCESYSKENKCFVFPKIIRNRNIPPAQIKKIIEKGETDVIKGFKGRNGSFNAKISFNFKNDEFKFIFENKVKISDLTCPFCNKGKIQETQKAFGCSEWKSGCNFTVWKNNNKITLETVEELIKNGKTKKIKGLKKKNGNGTYDAALVLEKDKKRISFDFS